MELMQFVLASASPRRAALLSAAGFFFELHPVDVDERWMEGERAEQYVNRMADSKAARALAERPGAVVLGADTAVVIDNRILGKPSDEAEAARMLHLLSGRIHDVLTGVCVMSAEGSVRSVERTSVRFLPMSEKEIAWYVATGEPRDKAGAYGVQGLASRFVEAIDGSYTNVVGLPIATVCRLLKKLGVEPWS
jgi:septum formation protein